MAAADEAVAELRVADTVTAGVGLAGEGVVVGKA